MYEYSTVLGYVYRTRTLYISEYPVHIRESKYHSLYCSILVHRNLEGLEMFDGRIITAAVLYCTEVLVSPTILVCFALYLSKFRVKKKIASRLSISPTYEDILYSTIVLRTEFCALCLNTVSARTHQLYSLVKPCTIDSCLLTTPCMYADGMHVCMFPYFVLPVSDFLCTSSHS